MTRVKNNANRGRREVAVPTPFEEARDELFQHIMSCGVIGSVPEDQTEWFNATMAYMTDRYPEIPAEKLQELRTLGERFAQPPKRQTPTSAASAA
ncbi:hypothetical protein [Roseisolibacter sp. H3M3-2]|uniref:hypothetical protein n=1 Tax=Roseisolibacter sp. H3M3-2 TaxID=3031323 RepID=UPI0023DCC2F0|nr:hypothetical protein [Roseisolibacter sp. H3M3-2]MDF1502456.1 hypothetical protein [Roseisolibacter sp. H3M3-2]